MVEEIETEERQPIPPPPPLDHYIMMNAEVGNLFTDRRYQRGLVKNQVRKLVEKWNWDKYHPIIISHRADGRYAVISGQQRTHAAIELGIPVLPALLITKTSIQQEANSYLGSGEVANIQAADRFKARLIANDVKAFAIWGEVEKAGFTLRVLQEEGYSTNPFAIEAVYAIETVFDTGFLTKTLDVIRGAWGGKAVKEMVGGNMIRGVYLAIRHLEEYEVAPEDLAKSLGKMEVKEVLDKGYDRYRSMVTGRSIDARVAAVLIDQYNYRRREPVPEFSKAATLRWRARAAGLNLTSEQRRASALKQEIVREERGRFSKRS